MSRGSENALTVRFWGVRGSHPVGGERHVVFGGQTPCVEIRLGKRLFVIDAGTGIIPLGRTIADEAPAVVDILFSHLHLDHVTGLPFFAPAFGKHRTIRTWCGNLDGASAAEALDRLYSPPLFPVKLEAFPATFEHRGFRAGETLDFEDGVSVRTAPLCHPSGATGYRFDHAGRAVCFVSDIEHDEIWPAGGLVDFVKGADLVIFDAMFSQDEYRRCKGWGHSTLEAGLALCEAAGAKDFAAFHHNPAHDDAVLGERDRGLSARRKNAFMAREGMVLSYRPRGGPR